MMIPSLIQRYHSYCIAVDRLLCEDYEYYTLTKKHKPELETKIKIFYRAMQNSYDLAVKEYGPISKFDTDEYIKSLTAGWFG